ncbi:hypothetical protein L2E82_10337 [Cichorium intybus]|uniref:Uncharacterized protein n=1 Tax=Cichorium intybus TaxID=13427 RepID=A0ACB9GAX1_CICIN|nr:hypothetical protein L2E82_10337 [Cichorium intybus]
MAICQKKTKIRESFKLKRCDRIGSLMVLFRLFSGYLYESVWVSFLSHRPALHIALTRIPVYNIVFPFPLSLPVSLSSDFCWDFLYLCRRDKGLPDKGFIYLGVLGFVNGQIE